MASPSLLVLSLDETLFDAEAFNVLGNLSLGPLQVVELDVACHLRIVLPSVLLDEAAADFSLVCLQLPHRRLNNALGFRFDLREHRHQVLLGLDPGHDDVVLLGNRDSKLCVVGHVELFAGVRENCLSLLRLPHRWLGVLGESHAFQVLLHCNLGVPMACSHCLW